jgi:hypothetical protein
MWRRLFKQFLQILLSRRAPTVSAMTVRFLVSAAAEKSKKFQEIPRHFMILAIFPPLAVMLNLQINARRLRNWRLPHSVRMAA